MSTLKRKIKESVKESIRHLFFLMGHPGFLDSFRSKRGLKVNHFKIANGEMRFREIYKSKAWVHHDGQIASSGLGSEKEATVHLTNTLPTLLEDLEAASLVDVGCGDWTWMKELRFNCRYLGIDIVPEVIQSNSQFRSASIDFQLANAICEKIYNADVALCREVLFHLSFEDGKRMLSNIKRSAKFLIATTNDLWINSDIRTGDFRNINLCRHPYSLPMPAFSISDNAVSEGRTLGVWRTEQIPSY